MTNTRQTGYYFVKLKELPETNQIGLWENGLWRIYGQIYTDMELCKISTILPSPITPEKIAAIDEILIKINEPISIETGSFCMKFTNNVVGILREHKLI